MSLFKNVSADKSGDNPLLLALAELKEENDRLRSRLSQAESRVSGLESFQGRQEEFNASTIKSVTSLQRRSDADNAPCPGCGLPAGVGAHGVFCFTARGADG